MPTQTGKHGKGGSLKGKSPTGQPTILTLPWPVKRPEWSELATIGALWATGWRLWPTQVWWIYVTLPVAGVLIYLTRRYGMLRLQAAFPFVVSQLATWHGSLQHKVTAGSIVLAVYLGHELLAWLAIDRSGVDDGTTEEDGADSTEAADDSTSPSVLEAAAGGTAPKHSSKPTKKKATGRRLRARAGAVSP